MVIQHNLTAMNAGRMLGITTGQQAKQSEKLASGYRINRASDDAAGLAISEKMRKQVRGLTRASANAQDGVSAVQTAEGALTEVHSMLQRMNELAVQSANGTNSETDRKAIQDEIEQLTTEIDRVSETTKFNETYLLKGTGKETTVAENKSTVGVSGYSYTDYAAYEVTKNEATGNIFGGKIACNLGKDTADKFTITYKDADDHDRTKEIEFVAGADNKETAANIAAAINADEDLKAIFTAASDADGNLTIESNQNKYELKSATASNVTGLVFDSSKGTTGPTSKLTTLDATRGAVSATGSLTAAAKGVSYSIDLSELSDGDTITIGGKTYTYDATKNDTADANTFKTLDELNALLEESGYSASLEVTATRTEKVENTSTLVSEETVTTVLATENTNALSDIDEAVVDNVTVTDSLKGITGWTDVAGAAGGANDVKYTAGSASLIITMDEKQEEAPVEKTEPKALQLNFHVGADSADTNKISVEINSMDATTLGIRGEDGKALDLSTEESATSAIDTITEALQKVSSQRAALGAVQNRLEHTIANLDNVVENTTAAESRIRDTDMAAAMVEYSKNNILAQAGQSMLAQANQSTQGVLSLLQ